LPLIRPKDVRAGAVEAAAPCALSARSSPVRTALEAGLDLTALLYFPLLVLAPRGLAALASIAGALAGGLVLSGNLAKLRRLAVPGALLAALFAWAALSAAWSIDPARALLIAARLGGLFAAGVALAAAAGFIVAPERLIRFLLAGMALGLAMAAIEFGTGGLLSAPFFPDAFRATRLNRASVAFALLILPVAAFLACRASVWLAILFAAATAAVVLTLVGTAAKVVLLLALAAGALCWFLGARAMRAAALLSVLVILTAPLTFARLERLPDMIDRADAVKISAGHRLMIWSFVGDRIAERPLAGWGVDASRVLPGGREPIRPGETWLPLHPHNAPLQLWLELGAPGVALAALLVASIWLQLAETPWSRPYAAGAGASFAAMILAAFATYGIWQEWWLGTLLLALFLIRVMARALPAAP
jgi:hypothetical protein